MSELDGERKHEREREWNKRHPPPRPSSSLSTSSNNSHPRSHPPRPPSATPYLTPTLASLQRQSSRSSLRSDSPTSSLASSHESLKERDQEEKKEVVHERERNWNSPHPKWGTKDHSHENGRKEGISPSSSLLRNQNSSRGHHSLRATSSLPHLGSPNGHHDETQASSKVQSTLHRADTTLGMSTAQRHKHIDRSDTQANGHHIDEYTPAKGSSPRRTPGATSRFGWHFPRSHPLPPLELDGSPDRLAQRQDESSRHTRDTSSPTPSSRPSSRVSGVFKSSLIPVRSVTKSFSSVGHGTSDMSLTHVLGDEGAFKKGHHRGLTEFSESVGRIPPRVAEDSWGQEDMVLASDEESIVDFPPQSTTPKTEPPSFSLEEVGTDAETEVLASPPSSPSWSRRSPPQTPPAAPSGDEARLQRVLSSFARSETPDLPRDEPISPRVLPSSFTPPGTPPPSNPQPQLPSSDVSQPFALTTPPRQTSFSSSIIEFRTPSPPRDLPDLPGPPLSSDDDALGADGTPIKQNGHLSLNPNYTAMKTPKPPGAWAVTPVPSKLNVRSSSPTPSSPESTPLASASTPLPRANSYPDAQSKAETASENGLLTPVPSLSRANSLPLRTPAPPGAWMATPNQPAVQNGVADQSQFGSIGRRRSILKVRFDVTESEASAAEGGHRDSPISAIRLLNPEFPLKSAASHVDQDQAKTGVVANGSAQPATSATPATPRSVTPERPTTPVSRDNAPSPRSLRKSPSVKVVDAYGRETVEDESAAEPVPHAQQDPEDAGKKTSSSSQPAPPPTPRSTSRSMLRIVDAMGREVDDTSGRENTSIQTGDTSFEGDTSAISDDVPIGHAAALARMRQTLRDLAEGLSDADRSAEDLALNSSHLEELDEVSNAARLARNQLAQNLHIETTKEHDIRRNPSSRKSSAWKSRLLPEAIDGGRRPWNRAIIYCSIIIQLILVLAIYAHVEARRLFYTKYYDPLYPELYPLAGTAHFTGTLSSRYSWTMLDSYETIQRDGWKSLPGEMSRALRHIGDQAWERWGEHAYIGTEKPT
ncbi:hypothetical protein HYDPIDRAFT_25316 [Hydnomerulius pinastri MD-312]|nr:hypothetical protein HYDPIDRAFT_25316 [Hydnomerulius pinastri MD-312]